MGQPWPETDRMRGPRRGDKEEGNARSPFIEIWKFPGPAYTPKLSCRAIPRQPTQTLRNYRHLGKGPAYSKRGRMVRYRLQDLLDFMEAGRIDPEAQRKDL
jgi:hypothetical protein